MLHLACGNNKVGLGCRERGEEEAPQGAVACWQLGSRRLESCQHKSTPCVVAASASAGAAAAADVVACINLLHVVNVKCAGSSSRGAGGAGGCQRAALTALQCDLFARCL